MGNSGKAETSIQGTLLMLDDTTPHVAVFVQAICDGKVIATTLSDENGWYQLTNLEPGSYDIRCHVLNGYVYYDKDGGKNRGYEEATESSGQNLTVAEGETLANIDFRFPPFKKGTWRSYNTLDGLAFNVINDVYQAPDGIMWFAGAAFGGGISKYDGKEFSNLTISDGLPSDYVWRIYADPDGVMWFVTFSGISRYDGRGMGDSPHFTNFTAENELAYDGMPSNKITVWSIYHDPDGVMWFGTSGGVTRYDIRSMGDSHHFINITPADGLPPHPIRCIQRDQNGAMWFGTWGGGVCRYHGGKLENFLPGNTVQDIHVDPDGTIWFATNKGVYLYDGESFVNLTQKDGLPSAFIAIIYRDPDGIIWLATDSGVSRYNGNGFVNFVKEDGLGHNNTRAIYRDSDGMMWFGTGHTGNYRYGGVTQYDEKTFINLTTKDGLVNNVVKAIYRDPDGVIWLGTADGLSRYNDMGMGEFPHFVNFTKEDGLVYNTINAIYRDQDGVMWFGTGIYGPALGLGGVSRYDGEKFTNLTTDDGLVHNCVNAVHCDSDGVMWFGTGYLMEGGVSRYDGKKLENFNVEDGLVHHLVNAIHCDPEGVLWFGTSGGVTRYDGRGTGESLHIVNFTTDDGLVDNRINAIYGDQYGMIWFGTSNGVSRYDGRGMGDCPHFLNFSVKDGLSHNKVISIYCDTDRRMWFGTDGGGVSLYDGVAWTLLDERDGLAGNSVISICQDLEGHMWFGTEKGVTIYRRSSASPRVHIVSVTTDQIYRDLSAIPAFVPQTRITIEYNSIDFKTRPEKRQYRCRIQAFGKGLSRKEMDSDWCKTTKETRFDWIAEEPGTYTFEVQAIDRDMNYSEPASLKLTVQPDPVLISLQTELNHLRREAREKYHFENIIGHSVAIRQVRALMERAIDSGLTVIITGETGTGKELVARAIHYNSPRKDNPLLARNCGAIPKELLASDLFGHCKGAFTGANEDKIGLFEAGSGGTLLLDEISEMPEDAQIHLLRVLQEREIQRLGENISREVDVRIIAMTNRDLVKEVTNGRFREDLYYRLSEFPINIPPLRERVEDIPVLAEHFLQEIDKKLDGFAPDVFEVLKGYPWPGNVRELQNIIRRAAALAEEGGCIYTYHFPSQITQGESLIQEILSERAGLSESTERFQRRLVEDALRQCHGNRTQAAQMLKMHRANFVRLMRRFGIE